MKIGAQFYTLRDKCTTLEDFSESLKRVADIGYTEVQISGVCEYEPEWLRDELKKNGLKCVITHTSADRIKESPLEVLKEHHVFGCNNLGIGCMPGGVSDETVESFIRDFKEPTRILAENGSKLYYHNHHFEFGRTKNNERILERILREFPENQLGVTLDTYWVQYGGANPAEIIRLIKGRAECIHLKDLAIVGSEQRMASVGAGNLNFEEIIKACEYAGSKHLLVEQDNCYDEDPFECLKKSYEYLRALGLE